MDGSDGRTAGPQLPATIDLWAPVGYDELPLGLSEAFRRAEWAAVKGELQAVMDGLITDGPYGRALLQMVRQIPYGIDSVLDRYRVIADIDFGDWDDVRRYLTMQASAPEELIGLRAIFAAPVSETQAPRSDRRGNTELFAAYESELERSMGSFRRYTKRIFGLFPDEYWALDYVPLNRHLRLRALHDAALRSCAEAHAGRLPVALALAREAQRLGDPGDPLRDLAHDLEVAVRTSQGERDVPFVLRMPGRLSSPHGPSPWGSWEVLAHLLPFMYLGDLETFAWSARTAEGIAASLGSPRLQLQSESWRVAVDLVSSSGRNLDELPGLLARARSAAPGLRSLPELLSGIWTRDPVALGVAERLSRRAGNVWSQLSALAWTLSINPSRATASRFARLLCISGWRRLVLVPSDIAADAALALVTLGYRGQSIIEFASATERPSVILAVCSQHLADERVMPEARVSAVEALGRLDSTHARETLMRTATTGEAGVAVAASAALRPGRGELPLSEREVEVIQLAGRGMTNREIAHALYLSPHTVARHLANARGKLGAANRAQAASMLADKGLVAHIDVIEPRGRR